ncbi:inactive phospholipase D5 isoform X2 [Austrofundulus limnaeus]|uniref:Inactive phospholipase D5 isoform X2 n=1 Tax=Austrofundulus limnaeus TaxID=52670 RepID=A0A2I4CX55_AUSLI|nr:PREDICTED: inactive phospholipase D5-like isoform X2 [Austrofundulus limnaeus]
MNTGSQQKCIVIFALVCCFAVLVALIFSAVDIWGEDEDGITEENCSRNCSIVLVENIPEDISFLDDSTPRLPLSVGLNNLLDKAERVVEIVSPQWFLNSSGYESSFQPGARQGGALLSRLKGLKAKGIQLKISSGDINSTELDALTDHYAEVHKVNTAALIKGNISSSFWVVDRKHFYIGSASMDWRSLATRKELGVLVYNCTCLALDLHRVFSLYWGLQYKDFIPNFWSKRLFPYFNRDKPANVAFNSAEAEAYISSSPDVLNPKDRSSDLEAISGVIQQARHFIYISVIDYLPLVKSKALSGAWRYWSRIDDLIREALILRKVRVRLLISCWEKTDPLIFNFVWSLKSLCMEQANCSLEAKFFSLRQQRDGSLSGMNHNTFMVTDRAIYLGNLNWTGSEFTYNTGAGLVISHPENVTGQSYTVVEQLRTIFERDWFSPYARPLQTNQNSVCSTHQVAKLVPDKASHGGPVPVRAGLFGTGSAPLRKALNNDGLTLKPHRDDRLIKISHQNIANEQAPIVDSPKEMTGIQMTHLDDRQTQKIDNNRDVSLDPTGQSAESSGFREVSNISL